MYESLSDRISKNLPLSESEIESGVELFGKRCKTRTKNSIRWALMSVPKIRSYGIFNRVHIENGKMSYCAGQSYPDEIRTVRECLGV